MCLQTKIIFTNSIICLLILSIAQFFKALCHQIRSLTFTEHLSAKFLKETFNLPGETTVPVVGLKGLLDQFRAKWLYVCKSGNYRT